jgi:pimeloyl-ACP methyl ester carboxylesterase
MLHSQIIGAGTPVVILHGFLGMGDNWKSLALKMAEAGYQVHLVDQRNHGRSFHASDFNYALLTQDLKAYLDHHGLMEIILLGHSMGGKTAMNFATEHPKYVTHLVVADIGPKAYPPHHQAILKALNHLEQSRLDSRKQADALLSEYIPEPGIRQFLLKNLYWAAPGQLGLRINLKALTDNANEIGAPLSENATFTGPTLFLKGARSAYILPEDHPGIGRHFPKAHVAEIPRAGHWLHAENPQDFLAAFLEFVQG